MRRTTPLTAASLLGLALLAPTAAATAAVEFCGHHRATIVGTSPTLTGTDGRDVVVTGAATRVDTLGGDDVVCVRPDESQAGVVSVVTGTGDDTVVLQTSQAPADTAIDAGGGRDTLIAASHTGRLAIDLERDVLGIDDVVHPATGLEAATLLAPEVEMIGDAGDNSLDFDGCDATVRGGAGDDYLTNRYDGFFESYTFDCRAVVVMNGGDGSDHVRGSVSPDRLVGGRGRDKIEGRGLDDVMRGNAGADILDGGEGRDDARGGGGNDELLGSEGADVLLGGGGRDRADGSTGRDRCVAEREVRCER